jgi:probable HAF family extracellular repeat protein
LKDGDTFIAIDGPNALYTEARSINNLGQIVGNFTDASEFHAFLKDGDSLTLVEVPGSTGTEVSGINSTGQIVGTFRDTDGVVHGFVRDGTTFMLVDVPNAIAPNFTQAKGINDLGQIVGWFEDASGTHAFLAEPTILLSPNGGEIIPAGSPYTIKWVAPAEAVKFKLRYSLDNGLTWIPIPKTSNFITGTSYDWAVPTPLGNKTKCLVRVKGFDDKGNRLGVDKSDATFTIEVLTITDPISSDTCTSGQPCWIAWNRSAYIDAHTGKLSYSSNGGLTWKLITNTIAESDTSYTLWAPMVGVTKKDCRVKLVYKNDKGITVGTATSGRFTINTP